MAPPVLASNAQRLLFRDWAKDCVFVLDVHDSPKRQFCQLAKLLEWVGGNEPWNTHWHEAFDEVYVWRAPSTMIAAATPGADIVPESVPESVPDPSSSGQANENPPSSIAMPATNDNDGSMNTFNIWAQFDRFKPDPQASFNKEFHRLARYMRWTRQERRDWRVEIFDADWEAYMGSDLGDLGQWQTFCGLCNIDPVPETIPECMDALEEVLVNIYDLLDSQRNGSAVKVFETFKDFRDYTRQGHMYPIEEARKDTFLPVFLKRMFPKRRL